MNKNNDKFIVNNVNNLKDKRLNTLSYLIILLITSFLFFRAYISQDDGYYHYFISFFLSLFFHFFNSVIVFEFMKKFTKNLYVSFFIGCIFCLISLGSDGEFYFLSLKTILSFFFILISFFSYILFLKGESIFYKYISYLCFFISLLFDNFSFYFIFLYIFLIIILGNINRSFYSFKFFVKERLFLLSVFLYLFIKFIEYPFYFINTLNKIREALSSKIFFILGLEYIINFSEILFSKKLVFSIVENVYFMLYPFVNVYYVKNDFFIFKEIISDVFSLWFFIVFFIFFSGLWFIEKKSRFFLKVSMSFLLLTSLLKTLSEFNFIERDFIYLNYFSSFGFALFLGHFNYGISYVSKLIVRELYNQKK